MSERVLLRDYTAEEMDRGEGMEFHPLCGIELRNLTYDPESRKFSYAIRPLGLRRQRALMVCGRISGGHCWSVGEPFPSLWVFDPYTGEKIGMRESLWDAKYGICYRPEP